MASETPSLRWRAYIAVPQAEEDALDRALPHFPFPTDWIWVEADDGGEQPELIVNDIAVPDNGLPDVEIRRIYTLLRERAGLEAALPLNVFIAPADGLLEPPRHFKFLTAADDLIGRGDFTFAVVAAQTASELYAEIAITELLNRRTGTELAGAVDGLLSSYGLHHKRTRKLFAALTGRHVQESPFWDQLLEHVKRRNAVVHSGDEMDEAGARSSAEVVRNLFDFIADAWTASIARPGPDVGPAVANDAPDKRARGCCGAWEAL